MAYRHGIYVSEVPTSNPPPVTAVSTLPVVIGSAPVHLVDGVNGNAVNVPLLVNTYDEAVAAVGFANQQKYTLCEFFQAYFQLYGASPLVLINVLDPIAKGTPTTGTVTLVNGVATVAGPDIPLSTLTVKNQGGSTTYVAGTDYTAQYDSSGNIIITRLGSGAIASPTAILSLAYSLVPATPVTSTDIIGGVNELTGAKTGISLVDQVFPRFRMVPGVLLAPGFSQLSAVNAALVAEANSINTVFRAVVGTDVDTTTVKKYSDVPAWLNTNNFVAPANINCWPKVSLGGTQYYLSTHLAGVLSILSNANSDIPYQSPSNQPLSIDSAVLADGTSIYLGIDEAAYLESIGCCTALNWIGGWRFWNNRTGAYPASTDPKDTFIPMRIMENWMRATIVLTYWDEVDHPENIRLVEDFVDGINDWLNGLQARGYILGGELQFRSTENPTQDLSNGIIRFHLLWGGEAPSRDVEIIIEQSDSYAANLFTQIGGQ